MMALSSYAILTAPLQHPRSFSAVLAESTWNTTSSLDTAPSKNTPPCFTEPEINYVLIMEWPHGRTIENKKNVRNPLPIFLHVTAETLQEWGEAPALQQDSHVLES